jgi:HSP20 family protein
MEENAMTLVRYKPNSNADQTIPRTFSQFLDNFFDEALYNKRPFEGSFMPGIDVRETDKNYEVEVALPGIKKDDIKVDLEDRLLTVSGERKYEKEEQGVKYHMVETRYGSFSRSITLPNNINRESVNATFEDGILKITIEKEENAVTKQIQIK